MKKMAKRCQHCRFFRQSYGEDRPGACLRYPPTFIVDSRGCRWAWPDVGPGDECGEFQWQEREE